jgi:CIC family chloride channel protein
MKKLFPNWRQPQWLASSSVDNRYALVEACLIGLFSALAALLLKQGIGWLGGWRVKLADLFGAGITLPLVGLIFGCLAGWAIELLSPAAAGGGIPQVKAALARYPIVLNFRVALVKALGTILILGAGFTLGRRGPTVHIGAALGAQVSRLIPNSPTNRRQMIAAGAAAGLAAGFNTPIAGVLFVVEELMRDISGLTLEIAIAASFTGAVVSRILGSADLNLPTALLDPSRRGSFAIQEIPFYVLLGILAGVLGGIFNRCIIGGMKFNRSLPLSLPLRIGLTGLISGLIIAFLPPFFRDNAGLREFLISGELDWQITTIILIAQFFLTILAYSSGAPGGLFAPALVLGSALGYLVGTLEVLVIGTESPHTFALAGMGAFFTAVVRVPLAAIAIVFEMTADFNLVLPLMIVSVVAYIVAESVSSGSLYEHLLEASGIKLTEANSHNDFLSELTAGDVMESRVETLFSNMTLEEMIKAMSRSHHRGFPVVEDGKLVGIVTQSDIPKDSQQQSQILLKEIMTPQPISVCATTSLADVLYLLNRYQLSRLPVTEGSKLLGIITRSDIIKAEVQQLNCDRSLTAKLEPSYLVYQTHAPATGRGRILIPIFDPQQVAGLIKIAVAIARYQKYEIELLQVISVPNYVYPAQAKVNTDPSRQLMQQMESWGKREKIPIHTQIRVATSVAEAILETITQEHINLLLMGWQNHGTNVESIFEHLTPLIQETSCDLMLVKLSQVARAFPNNLNSQQKWLIPTAGGENVKKAMTILPALANLFPSSKLLKIELCQVYAPFKAKPSIHDFKQLAYSVRNKMRLSVKPRLISSYSVSEAITNLINQEKHSLVILGASNEGLLQNAVKGNIPQAIAKHADTTVIIFRSSI